ncbi:arsenate reductase (glutaredoxin) [Pseudidiomarina taiwanensis]|uniref:Arsenate reductase n=1 Tax=Pseudidiomarina taiwanensis TaxID=337250 RepID=A0A432ZMS7_9GAMM|nr:arsenate reductase (glutaredoxin) [Pseudidiomarina taiwanensis]RUO79187.1 arsenate reductase (glutaredoxin) [Pseudidiomarina taiwanensis]
MTKVTIYHNPRCSKSRQTLQLLEQQGAEIDVVEYLKQPLSAATLQQLIKALGFSSARELMRTKEDIYKELKLADVSDEDALLEAMVAHPKLIERPIVVVGDSARLGRPPEQVLEIL